MAERDIKLFMWNSLQAPPWKCTKTQNPCRNYLDNENTGLTLRIERGSYVTSCAGVAFLVNSNGH